MGDIVDCIVYSVYCRLEERDFLDLLFSIYYFLLGWKKWERRIDYCLLLIDYVEKNEDGGFLGFTIFYLRFTIGLERGGSG